ncbi:MAG: 30S ribosome-binding factor RbfA [Clostridiales bacterium]|nr:30S ribosome-binding factor RbfA [Clostridiales bacterium]
MANRILKINSEIQKELSKLISYSLKDPRLEGVFVSVLSVDTTNELSYSKIKISVFPDNKKEQTFNIIRSSVPFLRKELAKNIKLRVVPELIFSLDEGYQHENKINQLLKEIKKDAKND